MNELTTALSENDAHKLCVKINAGIEDTANLLCQLYLGEGWAVLGYESWRVCCKEEFGKSASWACRQIKAAEMRAALPIGNDLSESQARELRKVPAEKQQEVLDWAAEKAAGKTLTAATIRHAAEEVLEAEPEEDECEEDSVDQQGNEELEDDDTDLHEEAICAELMDDVRGDGEKPSDWLSEAAKELARISDYKMVAELLDGIASLIEDNQAKAIALRCRLRCIATVFRDEAEQQLRYGA